MPGVFRSLSIYNYRVWASGAIVSNIGTWMQRTAQDWLVLTELSNHNASAVGIVMALQFGPQILLLALTGYVADNFDRRKVLLLTQASLGVLAVGQGLLILSGVAQLWHIYVFAFLLGCTSAFDTPARQTFVSELVGDTELPNAVALNSTSFNGARLIGPAVAGVLISSVGTGWVFIINAFSFAAVLYSLTRLRIEELRRHGNTKRGRGGLVEGFIYVWKRPDLKAVMLMVFLIGTFGLNFPIFISTMSATVFHNGAHQFGLLTSMMAIGSVSGALLAARRGQTKMKLLVLNATVFGGGCAAAAIMPDYILFGSMLVIIGMAAQTITTSTNSYVQISTEPSMRGRVIAIMLAITLGGTPIGAPLVGWIADHFGPRWSLGVGAASGFAAAAVGIGFLMKYRNLRICFKAGRFRIEMDEAKSFAPEN